MAEHDPYVKPNETMHEFHAFGRDPWGAARHRLRASSLISS